MRTVLLTMIVAACRTESNGAANRDASVLDASVDADTDASACSVTGFPARYGLTCEAVQDHVTGLIWQRRKGEGSGSLDAATAMCAALDLEGETDWRLPTLAEQQSIIDYDERAVVNDQGLFPDGFTGGFWTSTHESSDARWTWVVSGGGETRSTHQLTGYFDIRCVRGGNALPSPRFEVSADELTVEDHATGRTWQRAVDAGKYKQSEALSFCEALTLAGADDWRLPTIDELLSVVDYGRNDPAIDPDVFPNTPAAWFVSSTLNVASDRASFAWDVAFDRGVSGSFDEPYGAPADTFSFYVRCVR